MSECSPYFKGNYLSIQLKRLTGYMMREISMLPGQRLSLETQGIRKWCHFSLVLRPPFRIIVDLYWIWELELIVIKGRCSVRYKILWRHCPKWEKCIRSLVLMIFKKFFPNHFFFLKSIQMLRSNTDFRQSSVDRILPLLGGWITGILECSFHSLERYYCNPLYLLTPLPAALVLKFKLKGSLKGSCCPCSEV